MQSAVEGKVPHFFLYAKKKEERQVKPLGNGCVDRLFNIIQIYKFRFNCPGCGTFDYRMLMYNENIPYGEKEENIVRYFRKEASMIGGGRNGGLYDDDNEYILKIKELRKKMLALGSLQYITDILVEGLFGRHKTRKKSAFWMCFGDVIAENLQNNLPEKTKLCLRCGKRFHLKWQTQQFCDDCEFFAKEIPSSQNAICVRCGTAFITKSNLTTALCPSCATQLNPPRLQICSVCGMEYEAPTKGRPSTCCPGCRRERKLAYDRKRHQKKSY